MCEINTFAIFNVVISQKKMAYFATKHKISIIYLIHVLESLFETENNTITLVSSLNIKNNIHSSKLNVFKWHDFSVNNFNKKMTQLFSKEFP